MEKKLYKVVEAFWHGGHYREVGAELKLSEREVKYLGHIVAEVKASVKAEPVKVEAPAADDKKRKPE